MVLMLGLWAGPVDLFSANAVLLQGSLAVPDLEQGTATVTKRGSLSTGGLL